MCSASEVSPLVQKSLRKDLKYPSDECCNGCYTMDRKLALLITLCIFLSGLMGHTLTMLHYHKAIKSGLHKKAADEDQVDAGTKNGLRKKPGDDGQVKADKVFNDNLYNPSLASEMYYHPTDAERKTALVAKAKHKPAKPPKEDCHATVVIIRHCEKGSIREHCSPLGFKRAEYISSLFGDDKDSRWPAPSYLFATSPGQRKNKLVKNLREIETVQPLSDKIGVPINTSFGMKNHAAFSDHIFNLLKSSDMCGKVALVSWKHEDILNVARRLGCGPKCIRREWDGDDFDSTWQIHYSYTKQQYPSFVIGDENNKNTVWGQHPTWSIAGNIEMEGFDPLALEKRNGFH